MQNIGVKDNRFCYRYVVVFQYGSAVLFNIADHEAEYYLDIIRKHASGWLPEMRKDGKPSLPTAKLRSVDCFLLA
jgi:mannose/cellobiose epimerase-like protein (N-acyl-D-glucosamine 2-epimerase family)